MEQPRPDTQAILGGLKDFQRDTVEYVFRRLYLDDDCVRRFLVADEVGLGKTLVARGVIAKTIDYLWDRVERLDVIYVCSNSDIARQNINRLNVTGCDDFSLSSRITLLPITVGDMKRRRINFISFTPGTSFNLRSSGGIARERALIYWMLKDAWSLTSPRASRPFEVTSGRESFQWELDDIWKQHVKESEQRRPIHAELTAEFVERVSKRPELRERFDDLLTLVPPRKKIPDELRRQCLGWIGELRRLLAETCLRWLEPDLIILDEFQRFKHLLQGNTEDASEAAQLAEQLFNFQQSKEDSATAARVLLLSATPYKMYTQSHESHEDDHYADFQTTLDFLLQNPSSRERFHERLRNYREELFRLADQGVDELVKVKCDLESSLRSVMVRTERLALKADRDGMLVEVPPEQLSLEPNDLQDYLGLQRVANQLGHNDVLEFWKSAPYLLNFMEDYDFKRKLKEASESEPDVVLARAVRSIGSGLLNREEIERYQKLDPANARLRSLHHDTIGREAWRLLWMPPSLPYYQGSGPFVDPRLAGFTKRLVFSCWRVVPKAIASVLSYEAERSMMRRFRKKSYTAKRRTGLLQFQFSKGRPTGMPVLGMLYPCRTLADRFDPLALRSEFGAADTPVTQVQLVARIRSTLTDLLSPAIDRFGDPNEPADERWYWAAPLLLDLEHDADRVQKWFQQESLPSIWTGDALSGDQESARGWAQHVEITHEVIEGKVKLGQPPEDLTLVLAWLAIAGPGIVSLRALERILPTANEGDTTDMRSFAAPLAHSFLHLFNLPEVMYLLRDRRKEVPYWRSVLEYALAGNLQAVMDEFAHVLVESLGLIGGDRTKIAKEVCMSISRCLTLRTSTAQADIVTVGKRRVHLDESIRMRTRFAMRFGDQEAEDSAEPTRADHVRLAFNSPFWPFVLATTSVGQEGLDFHPYCHAVVHWNLPSNPVDLEQREGRVHRYKGHALRKNIAAAFGSAASCNGVTDPWKAMFDAGCLTRGNGENDLFPFWITPDGDAKIERHIPALPHSRETVHQANLRRSLVLYRMVFGQNRQEDLVEYLLSRLSPEEVDRIVELCRIDLSAPDAAHLS